MILLLIVGTLAAVPEFFDPQDPATPSILKHLDKYDPNNEKRFTLEEYKVFFYEVIYEELLSIGFTVTEEQREDLEICCQNFATKEFTSYKRFIKDFTHNFISYLAAEESRCPKIRGIWQQFFPQNQQGQPQEQPQEIPQEPPKEEPTKRTKRVSDDL